MSSCRCQHPQLYGLATIPSTNAPADLSSSQAPPCPASKHSQNLSDLGYFQHGRGCWDAPCQRSALVVRKCVDLECRNRVGMPCQTNTYIPSEVSAKVSTQVRQATHRPLRRGAAQCGRRHLGCAVTARCSAPGAPGYSQPCSQGGALSAPCKNRAP